MKRWRALASRLLPHDNPRCVAPPGALPRGAGRPVVLASLMRSGTHLAIDLVLNNFPAYRGRPLYVDADQWVRRPGGAEALAAVGAAVVKTHHPQVGWPEEGREALIRLAERAVVLRPSRPREETWAALQRFGLAGSREQFEREAAAGVAFWAQFEGLDLPFAELADPVKSEEWVRRVATWAGWPVPARVVGSPARDRVGAVLVAKAATRLLGHRAPRVNTTIQFAGGASGASGD